MGSSVPLRYITDVTERLMAITRDPALTGDTEGYALGAVVGEVLNGPWAVEVARSWASTLATLDFQASGAPDDQGVGPRILKRFRTEGAPPPGERAATALINAVAALHRPDGPAADLGAALQEADRLIDGREGDRLLWILMLAVTRALDDGGTLASSLTAAAAARDATEFLRLAGELSGDDGILAFVQIWVPLVASSCSPDTSVVPGDGGIARYLAAVLGEDDTHQLAALTVFAVTGFAPQRREDTLDQLYHLARAVGEIHEAAGGPVPLRTALALHAPAFGAADAILCRRAALITAAAAGGRHTRAEQYLHAARAAHGDDVVRRLAARWLMLLGDRLTDLAPSALGDPGRTLAVLWRGPLAGTGERAGFTAVFAAITALHAGDPGPANTLALDTAAVPLLIRLTGLLVQAILPPGHSLAGTTPWQ